MKAIILTCVLLLSMSCADSQNSVQSINQDEKILKDLIIRQNQAFREADFDGEAYVWAQEPYILRITPEAGPMVGWDDIGGRYKRVFGERTPPSESPQPGFLNHHFIIRDDMAIVYFEQKENSQIGSQTYESKRMNIRGFEKISDDWKMIFQYSRGWEFTNQMQEETYMRSVAGKFWNNDQQSKCADILHLMEQWYPESSRIQNDLGHTYLTLGDTSTALGHFQKAVALNASFDHATDMVKQLRQE